MNIIEELASTASARPEELKRQKEKGGRIVGYTGRSVPEELIYASGATPYLLCRGGDPEPAESTLPYMLRILSPYARSQMGYYILDLDPVMPLLDLIIAECSDCHMARLADLFEYFKLPTARLGIPPDWKKAISYDYYQSGLIKLKERLETLTGNKISDEKLRGAIESINKIRNLLSKISALREEQPPTIGGHDFIRLNHYSFYCDKEELEQKLGDLYEELKGRESPFPQGATRILLAGRVVAVGDYVVPQLIESSGGVVVAEFLDEGTMLCQWDVGTEGDLMRNIAETYYLRRTPPSVFQPAWEERLAFMTKLIRDSRIDGVVWYQLSFEEIYDVEYSIVSRAVSEMNIPILKLESSYEYSREAMGPLTTRIESFIESIKGRG